MLEQLKQKRSDIVLIDSEMPVMNGVATLDALRIRFPNIKVVVLGRVNNHYTVADFMARGAACYLTTDCNVELLFKALLAVEQEGYYFDDPTSKAILITLLKGQKAFNNQIDVVFSNREIEVIQAICDGKTNNQIAASLYLSTSTVYFHITKIYEKIGCDHLAGIIKYALRKEIITL